MMITNRGPNVFYGLAHFPCQGEFLWVWTSWWETDSTTPPGSALSSLLSTEPLPCEAAVHLVLFNLPRWMRDGVLGFQNDIKDNLIISKNNIFSAFFLHYFFFTLRSDIPGFERDQNVLTSQGEGLSGGGGRGGLIVLVGPPPSDFSSTFPTRLSWRLFFFLSLITPPTPHHLSLYNLSKDPNGKERILPL